MSVRRLADEQPKSFEFTPENKAWAEKELAKYPSGRQASAVLALLWRAQAQDGYWLSRAAIERVAGMLDMPKIRVLEVATFYTMFNLAPVGRYYVQLCGTTPCMLCGAEDLKAVCRKRIGEQGHVTPDGMFSWIEVECLGACCNAPMVQINNDYYEDLTPENFAKLLDDLAAGRPVKTGSQVGRVSSEPAGGLTSLITLYGADGKGPSIPPANDGASASSSVTPAPPLAPPTASVSPSSSAPPSGTAQNAAGNPSTPPAFGAATLPGSEHGESRSSAEPQQIETQAASSPAAAVAAPPATAVANIPLLDEAQAHAHAAAEESHINETVARLPADATPEQKANAVGARPLGLPAPHDRGPDDLQRIKGVGPVNERRLRDLGIFHFDQIASWTRAEIRWIATYLAFPGRIDREQWVAQASNLAHGGQGPKDGDSHAHLDAKPEV